MPSLSSYLGLPPRSSNAAAGLRPRIPRPYEGVLAHSFERVGGIGEDLGSHDLAVPEPVEPERPARHLLPRLAAAPGVKRDYDQVVLGLENAFDVGAEVLELAQKLAHHLLEAVGTTIRPAPGEGLGDDDLGVAVHIGGGSVEVLLTERFPCLPNDVGVGTHTSLLAVGSKGDPKSRAWVRARERAVAAGFFWVGERRTPRHAAGQIFLARWFFPSRHSPTIARGGTGPKKGCRVLKPSPNRTEPNRTEQTSHRLRLQRTGRETGIGGVCGSPCRKKSHLGS